jgi:hypothetical protein
MRIYARAAYRYAFVRIILGSCFADVQFVPYQGATLTYWQNRPLLQVVQTTGWILQPDRTEEDGIR